LDGGKKEHTQSRDKGKEKPGRKTGFGGKKIIGRQTSSNRDLKKSTNLKSFRQTSTRGEDREGEKGI